MSAEEPDCSPAPDATLVAATLGGRREAFGELVRRYERSARATCYGVLRDWHLAHDAAQEGFVRAYTSLRLLRDPASFGPWLLTIMRHRAANVARDRRPAAAPLHLVADPPEKPASPDRRVGALLAAVARLPEHERAVVMLDGHDVATIASICGRPLGTVTKQLSRAHERLRDALAREERRS